MVFSVDLTQVASIASVTLFCTSGFNSPLSALHLSVLDSSFTEEFLSLLHLAHTILIVFHSNSL